MTDPVIEQEIITLAHQWIDAIGQRDGATLERILADDFLIAGWLPDGQLGDRKTYLEDCLRPVESVQGSHSFDRWKVRIYGETAIANCLFTCHAVVGGKPWGGQFLFTQVWLKRDGCWQLASCHTSSVLAS